MCAEGYGDCDADMRSNSCERVVGDYAIERCGACGMDCSLGAVGLECGPSLMTGLTTPEAYAGCEPGAVDFGGYDFVNENVAKFCPLDVDAAFACDSTTHVLWTEGTGFLDASGNYRGFYCSNAPYSACDPTIVNVCGSENECLARDSGQVSVAEHIGKCDNGDACFVNIDNVSDTTCTVQGSCEVPNTTFAADEFAASCIDASSDLRASWARTDATTPGGSYGARSGALSATGSGSSPACISNGTYINLPNFVADLALNSYTRQVLRVKQDTYLVSSSGELGFSCDMGGASCETDLDCAAVYRCPDFSSCTSGETCGDGSSCEQQIDPCVGETVYRCSSGDAICDPNDEESCSGTCQPQAGGVWIVDTALPNYWQIADGVAAAHMAYDLSSPEDEITVFWAEPWGRYGRIYYRTFSKVMTPSVYWDVASSTTATIFDENSPYWQEGIRPQQLKVARHCADVDGCSSACLEGEVCAYVNESFSCVEELFATPCTEDETCPGGGKCLVSNKHLYWTNWGVHPPFGQFYKTNFADSPETNPKFANTMEWMVSDRGRIMDFEVYGAYIYYVSSPAMLSDWGDEGTYSAAAASTGLFRTPRWPAGHHTRRLMRPEFPDVLGGTYPGPPVPIKRLMSLDIHNGSIYMSAHGWGPTDNPSLVCQTQRDWWHCGCYEPGYDYETPNGSNGLIPSYGGVLRTDLPDNTF
jgi:hypothetical protein